MTEALSSFLQYFRDVKARSPATIKAFRSDLLDFFSRTNPDEGLTAEKIKAYQKDLIARNYKGSSINRKMCVIHTFLGWWSKQAPDRPKFTNTKRVIQEPPAKRSISEEEMGRLVSAADARTKLCITLARSLGYPISQVVKLTIDVVPKLREFPDVREALDAYLVERSAKLSATPTKTCNKLLINKFGEDISVRSIRRFFDLHCEKADIGPGLINKAFLAEFRKRPDCEARIKNRPMLSKYISRGLGRQDCPQPSGLAAAGA
jgi:site-specific recombinase XerD